MTPANEQDRAQVGKLAQAVQEVTGQSVDIAFVDQGDTGDVPAVAAKQHGMQLEVIKRASSQARLCFAAPKLRGGTLLRLDHT